MKTQTVSKEIPLAEITLRKYEKPYKLKGRELTKKLCLSIGLLQPGDSRDVVVDVLHTILKNPGLTSKEIEDKVVESRKTNELPLLGIASSNIRRQLKRLKDLFLVERIGNSYRIAEKARLSDIFTEKIEQYYLKTISERVKEYFEAIDREE
ncbi:MAG: helix-turn-helix domain-containing protein [Candidatus Woesearchaeota archaeon]